MTIVVLLKDNVPGAIFGKSLDKEDMYLFEVLLVRDMGSAYMIVPKNVDDAKTRWTWDKDKVGFIGIYR
jgi:hypothetical protein